MTKKSSSKRSRSAKKTTPAVRTIRYELTNSATPGTETSHYIDLAKDLSILNRRLYRQGKDYHVKKITLISKNTPNGENRVSVSTVPHNWVSQMAWKRAFKTWNEMNKTATSQISGDIQGTWADFKVFMDVTHRARSIAGTMLRPLDNGGNQYDLGEWEYSQLVTPDGTTAADPFQLHMLGDHLGVPGGWNSVGLVKSFGESRATVNSTNPNVPNVAKDDPLVNVFDYGTAVDEVVDLLEYQNDAPPYDVSQYPGDDTNGPKPAGAVMAGFSSFAGLIEIESVSPIESDVYSLLVELAPGKYRGIKAESI